MTIQKSIRDHDIAAVVQFTNQVTDINAILVEAMEKYAPKPKHKP